MNDTPERLPYEAPELTDLGDLRALTANSKMTAGDDMEGGGDS